MRYLLGRLATKAQSAMVLDRSRLVGGSYKATKTYERLKFQHQKHNINKIYKIIIQKED
jgi:hypothetical protein